MFIKFWTYQVPTCCFSFSSTSFVSLPTVTKHIWLETGLSQMLPDLQIGQIFRAYYFRLFSLATTFLTTTTIMQQADF